VSNSSRAFITTENPKIFSWHGVGFSVTKNYLGTFGECAPDVPAMAAGVGPGRSTSCGPFSTRPFISLLFGRAVRRWALPIRLAGYLKETAEGDGAVDGGIDLPSRRLYIIVRALVQSWEARTVLESLWSPDRDTLFNT